ncbi:hypothetical protein VTK56DRAFT_2994 [Thermocarpiscus australiensis]
MLGVILSPSYTLSPVWYASAVIGSCTGLSYKRGRSSPHLNCPLPSISNRVLSSKFRPHLIFLLVPLAKMKFYTLLTALTATIAVAAPAPAEEAGAEPALTSQACLPASCQSFGCCSGNCGYWCRACGISYTC